MITCHERSTVGVKDGGTTLDNAAGLPADQDSLVSEELTFLLGTAFQVVLTEFLRRLDEAGYGDLRPSHGMIFQILYGKGATSSELAERLGVTKQASGQLVTELEKRGYVQRQDHPQGGRRRLVVLTDKAIAHMRVAGMLLHQIEGEISTKVGDEGLITLRRELSAVIRAVVNDDIPPLRPLW